MVLVVAGHILRRTDNYRTTRITEWIPRDGKCSIWRQKVGGKKFTLSDKQMKKKKTLC